MRLIDADRLLTDRMKSKYYHLPNGDTAIPIIDIEHAPTIEPERPHGEWIFTGRHNVYGGAEIECSNCHNKLMVSPSRWEIGENFCDVCGSRNKKEGETE